MAARAKQPQRWIVSLLSGSSAKRVGTIEAESAEEAVERAAAEMDIPEQLRFKLAARWAG